MKCLAFVGALVLPFFCVIGTPVLNTQAAELPSAGTGRHQPSERLFPETVRDQPSERLFPRTPSYQPDEPLFPKTGSYQPDEPLFLLRLLEAMYENLPDPRQIRNAKELEDAVAERKLLTARIRTRIQDAHLDSRLAPMFADFDTVMDAVTSFHTSKVSISGKHERRGMKESLETGFKYGVGGGMAYSALQSAREDSNGSMEGTALVGLASAAIGFLSDIAQQAKDNQDAEQAEIAARLEQTMNTYRAAVAHAQSVAEALTSDRGWSKGEAGWSLDQATPERAQKLLGAGDIRGLLQIATHQSQTRPRDPFLRMFRVQLYFAQDAQAKTYGTREYSMLANECLDCSVLVPKARVYDEFRKGYLFYGAVAAMHWRQLETRAGISPYESTEASRCAVSVVDQCLELAPSDPDGILRFFRASALLEDGRVDEAAYQATQVSDFFRDNAPFQYNWACILSRQAKFSQALDALRRSFDLGYSEIADAKRDPDLTPLRRHMPKEFDDLVTVKFEWHIQYGILNDDIIVRNTSAFPLTKARLCPTLEQDSKRWKPQLAAVALIFPGQTYRWVNAVSIPGSKLTSAKASIECDQNN